MSHLRRASGLLALAAAGVVAAPAVATAATPAPTSYVRKAPTRSAPPFTTVQLLSFNDFHGHLEATDKPLSSTQDPSQTPTGGSEYLASTLTRLRSTAPVGSSLTVAAGDLIGGSPFLSGLFHDEPAVESLDALHLDVSSVGNHEFDEGTTELLRMQHGGCHPTDGCYDPARPYAGAGFRWLAANVVKKGTSTTLLPGTEVKTIKGVKVGFIGMTLKATPTLVSPGGVAGVDFRDEVTTANAQAALLKKQGVKSIVVLLHEGGYNAKTINDCDGVSEPIWSIARKISPDVDQIITGHTHQGYVCRIPDPAGNPRLVTSATQYGQAVTDTRLVINTRSGEVVRDRSSATNVLVGRQVADPQQAAIIAKWKTLSDTVGNRVVGSVSEDVTGDAGGDRGIETPMADLVADSILEATDGADGGAQIAFMNVGGVRASLRVAPKYAEAANDVVYKEAYDVLPFGNRLVTIDMTGAQIKEALEQQYQPKNASRGSRPMLGLGVSKGFAYRWDATQPEGSRVVPGSMVLDGIEVDPAKTYRVGTLSFLQEGGDAFTAFTQGTRLLGGKEDLVGLVDYLKAHPMVAAPQDRVTGL